MSDSEETWPSLSIEQSGVMFFVSVPACPELFGVISFSEALFVK